MAEEERLERRGENPSKKTMINKMVVIGDVFVGKTSILNRFIKNEFSEFQGSTVGATFLTRAIETPECFIKFEVWDTAGQERFQSVTKMYFRDSKAALVVYDITSYESYKKAKDWTNEVIKDGSPEIIIALVGNKLDLDENRQVPVQEAEGFAKEKGLYHYQTSAKTGENLTEMFMDLAHKVPVARKPPEDNNFTKLTKEEKPVRKGCC